MALKYNFICRTDYDKRLFESRGLAFSFLNPASFEALVNRKDLIPINYFIDGMILVSLLNLFYGKNVRRVSFDFTSLAHGFFTYAKENGKTVYFVGGTHEENTRFKNKIIEKYPGLSIAGSRSGYFDSNLDLQNELMRIISLSPDFVVAGLGAGFQEKFLEDLHLKGFVGTSFTCGGFIRQEAGSIGDYYPHIINLLSLRAFYRMYKEPHTVRRYFYDYPRSIFNIVRIVLSKRLHIEFL